MRNILIVFSIVLVILCAFLALRSNSTVTEAQKELNQERYSRMVAEESLEKANSKIDSLESELNRAQTKMKNVESLIQETKGLNQDLKSKLEKSAEINEELDKRIKELQQSPAPVPEASP